MRNWIAMLVISLLSPLAMAAGHVKAKLISDVAQCQPGQEFHLAVQLKIDPGWHIYWKNPGESGLPTKVQLNLDNQLEVGPWQYPAPELFELGGVRSYGYADEVVLITTVHAPGVIDHLIDPHVTATVKYLVCSEQCVPGKNQIELNFPTQPQKELIDQWLARVPTQSQSVQWNSSTTSDGWIEMTGSIQRGPNLKDTQWFPDSPPGLLIRDIEVQGSQIRFAMKKQADADVKEKSFQSVLSYEEPSGQRRVAVVEVPIQD